MTKRDVKRDVLAMGTAALALGLAACSGAIDADDEGGAPSDSSNPAAPGKPGAPGAPGTPTPGTPGSPGTAAMPGPGTVTPGAPAGPAQSLAGVRPLHRLAKAEIRNTIRDLGIVDDADAVVRDLPSDTKAAFGYDLASDISNLEVDRYFGMAAEAGKRAIVPARLKTLVACDPATGDEACARDFVVKFGRKAYRRPLEADEVTQLVGLFTKARTELKVDFTHGVRLVLQAMLQSPNFLYRWEQGSARTAPVGGLIKLSGHEVSARLSYFLWGSLPDQALFDAADANRLGTPAEVLAHAERMVGNDKTKDVLQRFSAQWLELDNLATAQKDPKIITNFSAVATSMAKETARFVESVFAEGGGKLDVLLGAPYSYVDETMAKLYGIMGVTGSTLRKVDLPAGQRLGVLTQGGFLASHAPPDSTSPVRRGKTVLERFMCAPPPPPPDGIDVQPPAPDPTRQVREQFDMHSQGTCRPCHVKMDAIGFAFESYDSAGKFRAMDAGRPVNTKVTIPGLDGADRDFGGAVDLVKHLTTSDQVRACMVVQWARFAFGRLEVAEEQGSLNDAYAEFKASGYDLRRLLVGLAKSKSFLHRAPYAWEVK
jgi:hypothetical protein